MALGVGLDKSCLFLLVFLFSFPSGLAVASKRTALTGHCLRGQLQPAALSLGFRQVALRPARSLPPARAPREAAELPPVSRPRAAPQPSERR